MSTIRSSRARKRSFCPLSRRSFGRIANRSVVSPTTENHASKVRHPFRAPHGIGDGHRAALGYPEERETLDANRVNDRLKVGHPGVERERDNVPVGHAVASRVVANERMLARQPAKDMAPNRAFPIVFKMVHPVARLNQEWPAA